MLKHWHIPLILAGCISHAAIASPSGHSLSPAEKQFALRLDKKDHLPAKQTRDWLSTAHIQHRVIKQIKHPAEAEPWARYQRIFITEKRIQGGVDYWVTHHHTLAKAERSFGVPAALIVAIIGVESNYGRQHPPHHALDTLDTLAFYGETRRQAFFQTELENLLLLCRDLHITPDAINSSYAGAIGFPQFMPSSYRRIAYPATPHTTPDLIHNHDDAIMSVGNYFKHAHWQQHQLVASPYYPHSHPASQKIITLSAQDPDSQWLVYPNFYAIMTYNHSHLYAMTVALLAQRIKRAYHDRQHPHAKHHQHLTQHRTHQRRQIRL